MVEWTWLVFMAGDNNLESAGLEDLKEMQKVGSTPEVNLLVQFDTERQKTVRYRVERGKAITLQSMRGVDCGDPKVLTDFIGWGMRHYPAERYALVVWNHGGGWQDQEVDYEANRTPKPRRSAKVMRAKRSVFRTTRERISRLEPRKRMIAIDCGAQDYLDNVELRQAVEKAGRKLDVLGCDACLMNMVEIAYEMKDTAQFLVGSEETEPGRGWPYADILRPLVEKPGMPTRGLAQLIVRAYGKWYRAHGRPDLDGSATQSACDLAKVGRIADAVDALAKALMKALPAVAPQIALARERTLEFDTVDYIDLGDFAQKIAKVVPKTQIANLAGEVTAALKTSMVANATWGDNVKAATGLSIFFPRARTRLLDEYRKLRFSKSHPGWCSFLAAYRKP